MGTKALMEGIDSAVVKPAGGLPTDANIIQAMLVGADGAAPFGGGSQFGFTANADFTPTAVAYGAGDIMDAAKQFNFVDRNGLAVPAGSLIRITTAITKIDVTSVPAGQTSYNLPLYSVAPPSAQADNALWDVASGDLPSYRGSLSLGAPADLGSTLYIKASNLDNDIKLADGLSSLFARLVTVGAHTPAAVARQVFLYGFLL